MLRMVPSAALGEELRREEEADLRALWESWTPEERLANRQRNEALLRWQQTPDSPEALSKIPQLPLSAVSTSSEWTPTKRSVQYDAEVLFHRVSSGNIVYAGAYFDLTGLDMEQLSAVSFASKLFGKLPTRRRSAEALDRLLKSLTGSLSFMILPLSDHRRSHLCRPMLTVRFSALKENFDQAAALIAEILLETCFSDPEKIRIIARQTENAQQRLSILSGQNLGMIHALSHHTAAGAVSEATGGLTFYGWVRRFLADFDARSEEMSALALQMQRTMLCRRRLTLSLSAPEAPEASAFLSAFPEGTCAPVERSYVLPAPERAGFRVPARVSYAVQGYHLSRADMRFCGGMKVGAKLLSLDYLWNKVRVQGGAYGARFFLTADGDMYSYSYRDPSPHATLRVNLEAADYIRRLCAEGVPLECYILSASSEDDPLLSPRQAGEKADMLYFSGFTREDAQRTREEILATTHEDILRFCDLLQEFARKGSICVVGHADALERCGNLEAILV